MKIKLLLIAELEVAGDQPLANAQAQLDAFREAVQPAAEYGLTLYQATTEDLAGFGGALSIVVDRRPPGPADCPTCSGAGHVDNPGGYLGTETCPTCAGTGRLAE